MSYEHKSLTVGPLCTGLDNARLGLAGSMHGHTVPFGIGMNTELLHHFIYLKRCYYSLLF